MHQLSNSQHEQIEKLAYQLWEARAGLWDRPTTTGSALNRNLCIRRHDSHSRR
jgi:hypothetical protein